MIRSLRPFLAVLLAASAPAFAETVTEVTATRVEGPIEEMAAFYHDEDGVEVFAFETYIPVTVTVTRLNGSDWTEEDIVDAWAKLGTCPAAGPHVPEEEPQGAILVLRFTCSVVY